MKREPVLQSMAQGSSPDLKREVRDLSSWCQGGEAQSLSEFRFPHQSLYGRIVVDPLARPFVALEPVIVQRSDIHFVDVIRC
jgi:hypothetical protein